MAGVTADIGLNISASLVGTGDLGNPRLQIAPVREALQLLPGTLTVGQADIMFADTRTLAASATENLDLTGTLINAFGATINAAEIVMIYIKAAKANVNSIIVGNVANGFVGPLGATGQYTIKPGEYYLAVSASGWGVTAATADLLKILNGGAGTAVSYDVVIIGRTVAA
ncbi:MAG TPA: hypothetical protein VKB96_10975 [Gammaproteobacteria bacterium]|nr:hypothetical protein [Gammaproteobacteria bacterium]